MSLAEGVRQLLKRCIQRNFASALPTHGGDSALVSVLGKKVFWEAEVFLVPRAWFQQRREAGPAPPLAFEG